MNPVSAAYMRSLVLAVILLSLFAQAAPAQTPAATATPPSTAAVTAPSTAAPAPAAPLRPTVKAIVTGNNVNIRKGPGTEYPAYLKAPMGYEVDAIAQKGEWLEIELPPKESSWISREYLQKIDDKTGIVIGNNVNVRLGPGTQFDQIYTVPVGQKFQVLQMDIKGEWYRVAPMPADTAYILYSYVRLTAPLPSGVTPVTTTAVAPAETSAATVAVAPPTPFPAPLSTDSSVRLPAEVTPGRVEPVLTPDTYTEKLADTERKLRAEVAKENPNDWDLESLVTEYDDIYAKSSSAAVRSQARVRLSQLKTYALIQARAKELNRIDEDLKARMMELEKQRAETIMSIPETLQAPFTATGLVEKFGLKGVDGATHKLVDGDRILYLLKSDVVDLSQSEGKLCGVRGTIVTVSGFNVRLIQVESIKPLEQPASEPAE